MAREIKKAQDCTNFTEYQGWQIRENSNLSYGDGECPGVGYIINGNDQCPKNHKCSHFEEVK